PSVRPQVHRGSRTHPAGNMILIRPVLSPTHGRETYTSNSHHHPPLTFFLSYTVIENTLRLFWAANCARVRAMAIRMEGARCGKKGLGERVTRGKWVAFWGGLWEDPLPPIKPKIPANTPDLTK